MKKSKQSHNSSGKKLNQPFRIAFSEICPSQGDASPPGSPVRALGEIKKPHIDFDSVSESPYLKAQYVRALNDNQSSSNQQRRKLQRSKLFKEMSETTTKKVPVGKPK
jgi:hypothetical protein